MSNICVQVILVVIVALLWLSYSRLLLPMRDRLEQVCQLWLLTSIYLHG